MTHLRAQGDLLKGKCATKCSKFDFEKFENSIFPLKGACAPMRVNRVSHAISEFLDACVDAATPVTSLLAMEHSSHTLR